MLFPTKFKIPNNISEVNQILWLTKITNLFNIIFKFQKNLFKNPDIAERTLILQIERILSGATDSIRQELQRQMPVIGPLDGNLPPTL